MKLAMIGERGLVKVARGRRVLGVVFWRYNRGIGMDVGGRVVGRLALRVYVGRSIKVWIGRASMMSTVPDWIFEPA